MSRLKFDDGWNVLVGELDRPVLRNTAKTATCGGPSDLTGDEGGKPPLPDGILDRLGPEMLEQIMSVNRSLSGEWLAVQLPDDWTTRTPPVPPTTEPIAGNSAVVDPAVRGGFLPTGPAWYRKVFDIPTGWDGRRIRLDFDGVMRDAHVWVNGSFIGSHYSGYTGFSLDVTEFLRYGDEGHNVVLVGTDTTTTEGWWAEGGGIYRHVWLVVNDPVHVARHGVFVSTTELATDRATVTIRTEVNNDGVVPQEVDVIHTITTPTGATSTSTPVTATAAALGRAELVHEIVVESPLRWDVDEPNLYELHTAVSVGGAVVDQASTTFGIRTVEYLPDGLVLNGVLTPIHGVCCHQDFAGVGIALPDRVHEYKVAQLKQMGCNAYRTAHHAPAPELLDACDRLGMLVLDENRRLETNEVGIADLTELIRRDRNHPSVFMWSLENEELIEGSAMSRRLLRRLVDVAHQLDPTRLTTVACGFGKDDHSYMSIPDVAGFNYDGGASGRYREAFRDALVMATEDSSAMSSRGVYLDDPSAGLTSSYDEGGHLERVAKLGGVGPDAGGLGGALGTEGERLADTERNRLANPYLGGVFVWTGFDYRGECAPFGWPAVNSPFGTMDLAGFPKDLYHYWRSRWSDDPVVHLFPHWNWPGREGQETNVVVYSNCDEVEVLVNGRSVRREPVPDTGIVTIATAYEPGTIQAIGSRADSPVATTVRETTGQPISLRLSADDTTCAAGGDDVVIVRVDVIDAGGRVVPTACPDLEFTSDGGASVLGTGSGSPADHVPAVGAARAAFNGHALAIVRGPATPGTFTLTVTGDGVAAASIAFEAV